MIKLAMLLLAFVGYGLGDVVVYEWFVGKEWTWMFIRFFCASILPCLFWCLTEVSTWSKSQ